MEDLVQRLRAEDPETGLRHSIASEAADEIEGLHKLVTSYEQLTRNFTKEFKDTIKMVKELQTENARLRKLLTRAEAVMSKQDQKITALLSDASKEKTH